MKMLILSLPGQRYTRRPQASYMPMVTMALQTAGKWLRPVDYQSGTMIICHRSHERMAPQSQQPPRLKEHANYRQSQSFLHQSHYQRETYYFRDLHLREKGSTSPIVKESLRSFVQALCHLTKKLRRGRPASTAPRIDVTVDSSARLQ